MEEESLRRRGARRFVPVIGALALTMGLVACSGGDDEGEGEGGGDTDAASQAEEGDALDLASVCPETIVIQKDWQPESEHGMWYQMLGDDYELDLEAKSVRASLMAGDTDTGVDLEIRSGGPAIGFQPPAQVMYTDDSITFGYLASEEAVQFSEGQPMISVMAALEISPLAILWDAGTYPEFNTITDIGQTNTTVLYTDGLTYMNYLTGSGQLRENQLDGSYDGSPGAFVAAEGTWATQGFATSEPYIYENEVDAWGKPLDFQLLHDTGFPTYFGTLGIRSGDLEELSPCLERFVPIAQQSTVEFMEDPEHAIGIIVDAAQQYDTGWVYSEGLAGFSHEQMGELGIIGNGPDDTLGNFDMERVQQMIDIVTPIFEGQNAEFRTDLTPEDIATNEFIDDSISYVPAS
jgi:hypothetical protein